MYFYDDIPRTYCLREITAAINASPSLANLEIRNYNWHAVAGITPLQLFLQSRPELVQLELGRVPLPSTGIREILSQKLQQLSISTPLGDTDFEFDWRRLWSALQESRTALSFLEVSGMANAMDKMLGYLLSYTGLQRLEITNMEIQEKEKENGTSLIFWRKIIPHHRDSLTKLSIQCSFEGGWCYGPQASAALRQCLFLRDLTLSVCRVESSWAEETLSRAHEYSKIEFRDLKEPDGAVGNCGVRPTNNGVS